MPTPIIPYVVAVAALTVLVGAGSAPASAQDFNRGRLLYDTHCPVCHESELHIREKRIARNFADIRAQVWRWSTVLDLDWSVEEVTDVTDYLNGSFYRYPCAIGECSPGSSTPRADERVPDTQAFAQTR